MWQTDIEIVMPIVNLAFFAFMVTAPLDLHDPATKTHPFCNYSQTQFSWQTSGNWPFIHYCNNQMEYCLQTGIVEHVHVAKLLVFLIHTFGSRVNRCDFMYVSNSLSKKPWFREWYFCHTTSINIGDTKNRCLDKRCFPCINFSFILLYRFVCLNTLLKLICKDRHFS